MSSINLGESFVGGLRAPHYANGRLLTAEDLKADQEAVLGRLGYTGEAAGAGIVRGLEVQQVANNLRVTAGLGINRKGQALCLLEESVELSPAQLPGAGGVVPGDGRFNDCGIAPAEGGALVETGAYLLTASPVSQMQGSVSVKAVGTNPATCASRWEVEGVQFKALRLEGAPLRDANNASIYRNLLAHWCFGTQALRSLPQDPFTFPAAYAPLDQLSEDELPPCDLPLAVFYWENGVLRFVDQWAVRRRVTHPFPSAPWHALLADRRVADAQARFLQFQAQVEEMRSNPAQFPNLLTRYGGTDFRYLPPAGLLPIAPPAGVIRQLVVDVLVSVLGRSTGIPADVVDQLAANLQSRVPATRVFDLAHFFGPKLPWRTGLMDRDLVDAWLNRSWYDEPLDFAALPDTEPDAPGRDPQTAFDVYLVADELKVLVMGLVKLMFKQLTDEDVAVLGTLIKNLGAEVTLKDDGVLTVGFGRKATTAKLMAGPGVNMAAAPAAGLGAALDPRLLLSSTRRFGKPAPALDSFLKLDDAAGMAAFLQAAQLPPQYALFVKNARPTLWINRLAAVG